MDHFAPIHTILTNFTEFSESQLQQIRNAFKVHYLSKKQYLLQPGSNADSLYFVSSGCVRVFRIEMDKEIIMQFGVQGSCVSDLKGYLCRKPSEHYIQAIEPSVVLQVNRNELDLLFDQIPPLERFFRIKFQNAHSELQERHFNNLSMNAKDRYEQFRSRFKDLEQRIPQYMIASYLGISKEFLSFIRRS